MENKVIQLENEIRHIIHSDNGCEVDFEYKTENIGFYDATQLSVYTFNPITKEYFLLIKSKGSNKENAKEECLEDVLEYIKTQKELDSFTITWNKKDSNELTKQTSYFYCYDIQDAINKFFTGKNVKNYIIYEVKMNARA